MPALHRDSQFSMSVIPPVDLKYSHVTRPRISYGRRLERQVVRLWKTLTRPRTKQRASIMPRDFVAITSRRRSTMPSQFKRIGA